MQQHLNHTSPHNIVSCSPLPHSSMHGLLNLSTMPGQSTPQNNFRTRATNCTLLTISVVCMCVLVVVGVMIVREYALGKDFEAANCRLKNNMTYGRTNMECSFCENAKEKGKKKAGHCFKTHFPCVQIAVVYQDERGRQKEGLLHPDSIQATGPYRQCSYSVCLKHFDDNKRAVEKYAATWRVKGKEEFQCYYNIYKPQVVIVEKKHSKWDVLHGILWPCLGIFICGVIFLKLETKRRGIGICDTTGGGFSSSPSTENNASLSKPAPVPDCRNGKNCEAKETLLQLEKQEKVQCKIMKDNVSISTSLSALDKLKVGENTSSTCEDHMLGSSVSMDGLRVEVKPEVSEKTSASGRTHLSTQLRQDSTKTDCSSTGSQGSKIMGLETPV